MDFREIPASVCPIKYLDTFHLILAILYKRAVVCKDLDLSCLDLPILATTPLVARNCSRNDVHKFFRRIRRIVERMGNEIEIFSLGKFNVYLSIEFVKGNIKVHDMFIVSEDDCNKIPCTSVNNVTMLYMRLIVRMSDKNLIILNVPDAIVWIAKVYGIETVYNVLNLIHDYVERGVFNDGGVDAVISIVNRWGISLDRDSLINATLPGRKNLIILRELLKSIRE